MAIMRIVFPSPDLGLSLKYYSGEYMVINNRFPSPYLGLSLKCKWYAFHQLGDGFPSPYLGLSLKLKKYTNKPRMNCFRPLIWGYL